MEQQIPKSARPSRLIFSSLAPRELSERIDELKFLCHEVDPYAPLSDEVKAKLKKFHITDFYDPFTITNKLLILMEDALEEFESRNP